MEKIRVKDMVESVSITHSFNSDELIFLNTSDIFNGEIINKNKMKVIDLKGQAKKTIENDDILFSEIRPKNKRFAYVSVENPWDYVVSTKLMVLRNKNSRVLQKYFYYFITSDSMLDYLQMRAESRIGSFPQITFSLFADYEILLPTLKDQSEIVRKLDILSDKIDTNNKLITNLEEYSQLLFHKWFVDFNFSKDGGKPYKDSGGEMVEVDGNLIPKGWEIKTLNDLTDLIIDHRGKTPTKLGGSWAIDGVIAISALNVKNGRLVNLQKSNRVDNDLYKKWMKEELKEGDILMTSEAPLGEFYLILENEKYCLSQRLFAIRCNQNLVKYTYLYNELSQPRGRKKIIARQSGSTVFGIRQEELRKVEIIVPDYYIQEQYDNSLNQIFKKIRLLENENKLLDETRYLLIKKLIK